MLLLSFSLSPKVNYLNVVIIWANRMALLEGLLYRLMIVRCSQVSLGMLGIMFSCRVTAWACHTSLHGAICSFAVVPMCWTYWMLLGACEFIILVHTDTYIAVIDIYCLLTPNTYPNTRETHLLTWCAYHFWSTILELDYYLACGLFPLPAKGRTNIELREQFILAQGVSQSMTGFRSKVVQSPTNSQGSGGSSWSGQSSSTASGPIMKVRICHVTSRISLN